jgi:hypothetical protein
MIAGAMAVPRDRVSDAALLRPTSATTTVGQAILSGWLLCGVLDITAACIQSWIQAGRTPAEVL